ncbi:hypothetical protein PLESTB_001630000 [Pleodorina starrii]|uniref:Uncharacterized protein n=1 Tax=Pleodorina starrii TaxID=330485 RepID=A0A9W6BXW8_9CHLO|nr:hypothetical protein PLESTM_000976300 [Pleodorina starrii]GLC60581.1 hypothetical protein PLESTB_001630000 [Pleodorina starrii]GLC76687.1 hypothetical protein PLESTF_001817400 [Pleodorina starrii]
MDESLEAAPGPSSKAGGAMRSITHRTFARSGLFGNPSDQYGGQTIAFLLENFYAEVTLTPSAPPSSAIRIQPHPVYDSTEYGSMRELVVKTSSEGLYGGVRLLTAATKRFAQYCEQNGIPLRNHESGDGGSGGGGGFTLSYDTNVPRQTGLAGSSAIIYSAIKCLMEWYGVDETVLPYSEHPGLVLSVEAGELGIAAGLQDRVVQVYGGAVHMDFAVGRYSRIDSSLLPQPLYVMYSANPSESGKVHSGVKQKWLAGDPQVRSLMSRVVECGREGLRLLLKGAQAGSSSSNCSSSNSDSGRGIGSGNDPKDNRDRALVELMNRNADLRRELFGDEVLGALNLRMVELARAAGAGVNYTGSGGAVVVFCPRGEQQAAALAAAAAAEGFTLERARVGPTHAPLPPAAGHRDCDDGDGDGVPAAAGAAAE